jgi:hypothetical protein
MSLAGELSHEDVQTDRHNEVNIRFSQLYESKKSDKGSDNKIINLYYALYMK